jgi:Domain of unknown function (DUF5753)
MTTRVGNTDIMAGQLDRLLAVMSLPRVSLGIIPQATPRKTFTQVPFWIYDNTMVGVETPTAKLEITQPREIRLYAKMFEHLTQTALHGTQARTLIHHALTDLENNP